MTAKKTSARSPSPAAHAARPTRPSPSSPLPAGGNETVACADCAAAAVHPRRVRDPVSEPTKYQCPACGEIVDKADLIQTETPEDFEEVDVSDLDAELPEKYRGTGAVKCHVRRVHISTDCIHCHDKHVH